MMIWNHCIQMKTEKSTKSFSTNEMYFEDKIDGDLQYATRLFVSLEPFQLNKNGILMKRIVTFPHNHK